MAWLGLWFNTIKGEGVFALIKLKEVTKYYYGDASVTLALKNINLEFKKGEFVAITGQSGSGKSTLINLISGMDSYEEGEMYFKGMETSYFDDSDWELYRKNNISFVYQSYNLIESYTALQNVETVMMICETDENRRTKKQRKQKAMEVLKKVGLEKQAHNRASHMSSGQKQRLGIARALAKETDVIVADEPTGNLDVENGKAIMAILHELAKENKLVLVVTHNYEQAQEYVTRKIRLFDGEIVEDVRIDRELYDGSDFQSDFEHEAAEEKEAVKTFSTARAFVHMNRLAQPHRSLFILMFMLASALATLVFIGYFAANLDDFKTRTVTDTIFANTSDDRLMARRLDGNAMTDDDLKTIADMPKVELVEKYDGAGDYYYFAEENTDYKKVYSVSAVTKAISIDKLSFEHFVKTAGGLTQENLRTGRLPESLHEIVIYSGDDSLLGKTQEIYVCGKNWKPEDYIGAKFTVVGILKEDAGQIYFAEPFAKLLDKDYAFSHYTYNYIEEEKNVYDDNAGHEDTLTQKNRSSFGVPVIGEGLTGNQVRLSENIINEMDAEGTRYNDHIKYKSVVSGGTIELKQSDETTETFDIEYVQDGSICSRGILEVSEELFDRIMGEADLVQASVYIEDYAYTDAVLDSLYDAGYDAVSTFRVSTTEYDGSLVSERLIMLAVSVIVILIIFVLDILVIYLLMKLKRGDFLIMKSLGMKQRMAGQMNFYELVTLALFADILAMAAGYICLRMNVPFVCDIMKYCSAKQYVMLVAVNTAMAVCTAGIFNRYLRKRFRLTALKND